MPFELIKTTISQRKMIGSGTTQVLVEGDIIVPDIKSDILDFLRVQGNCCITEEKAMEDKVAVKGGLRIDVLYTAKKSEKAVHSMSDTISFEDFVNIDSVNRQSDVSSACKLEHLEYRLVNDRKIGIKAIIAICATAWEKQSKEITTDVDGENLQLKTNTLEMTKDIGIKKDTFDIRDQFNLDRTKPDVAEILQCDTSVSQKEVRAVNGGINIKGEVLVSIIYTGAEGESPLEVCEFYMPINGTVEISDMKEDMIPFADLSVEKTEAFVLPNTDGEDRIIDVEVTLQALCGAKGREEVDYIEDAYSTVSPLKVDKETIEYTTQVGSNTAKGFVKDVVSLDKGDADIMQVLKCWGKVMPNPPEVVDNGVMVDGGLKVSVMYIAKDDASPVASAEFLVPFEQMIEIAAAKKGDVAETQTWIDRVSVNMLSGTELEIAATIVTDATVSRAGKTTLVTDVSVDEGATKKAVASVVIYVVQKCDTLWKIAKNFNTTVDNILMVNDIENPDLIFPGQKILILKKVG